MDVTFMQDEVGLVQFYHATDVWTRIGSDHDLIANKDSAAAI